MQHTTHTIEEAKAGYTNHKLKNNYSIQTTKLKK